MGLERLLNIQFKNLGENIIDDYVFYIVSTYILKSGLGKDYKKNHQNDIAIIIHDTSNNHDSFIEAIVAAIYYDIGIDKAKKWIRHMIYLPIV